MSILSIRNLAAAAAAAAATAGGLSASAALIIVGTPLTASDDASSGVTTFANVEVLAGDRVVISTAINKNSTTNALTYAFSGTEAVDGVATTANASATHGAYLYDNQILNAGTYTFTITPANTSLTANSALYILRADSGIIAWLDTDIQEVSTETATSAALSYSFASPVNVGDAVAIEAAASAGGDASYTGVDADYTDVVGNGVNGRLVALSTNVSGSSWDSTHTLDVPNDVAAVGAVFAEVPEPGSLALLTLGSLLVSRRRRA